MIEPVAKLAAAAGRLGDGDLKVRVDEEGSHEVVVVGRAFNAMAGDTERHVAGLNEVAEMKSRFVASVAHELRGPLTSIRGFAEALLDPDTGRLNGDQPQLAARGIEVTIDCEPGLAVDADPLRLHQALGNLFSNAVKFSEHGGKISVSTRREADRVVIELTDRGVGIPASELERVVERFYRASTANGAEGTGLGLAIAKEIVERHGGTMSLASQLGEGTIATIKLPLSEAVTARHRPPRALAP